MAMKKFGNEKPFVAMALLVLLWACSSNKLPLPKPCATDDDCDAGQKCHDGFCRQECMTSNDCPDGQQCISGVCLIPCGSDGDCPAGQICEGGFCRPKPVEDGGDGDGGGPQCIDVDGDGYGQNCTLGPDCDDSERTTHPGAMERCNDGQDNDCDGQTDEAACGCEPGTTEACYEGPFGTQGVGLCRAGVSVCQADRSWGECVGQRLPGDEVCNGLDENCDGETDEGLLNACGLCGEVPPEQCGDGLDNDCDGQMDEDCSCDPNCLCSDPGSGQQCECHPPTHQPCYSGPPNTLGFGQCKGGFHDCVEQPGGGWEWTVCAGEVLPGVECAGGASDGLDNDCDGAADEGCLPDGDHDGWSPPQDCDDGNEAVHPGATEVCNGVDDNCDGLIDEGVANRCGGCGPEPAEACADGLDNDCDGEVDEGCGGCSGGQTRPCYRGPDGTQGVGQCHEGEMYCDGEFWSACEGDVIPQPEVCDGADNDCDTDTDERWAIGSNACGWCDSTEACDGVDNDCDGLTDEGLRNGCGDCIFCAADADCPADTVCDPGTSRCRETACDGLDNNCDGLIDEGLLSVCGTCDVEPCYEIGWDTPGDCDEPERECDGVIPDPGDPDSITLGQGTVRTPFIYISVTGSDQVAKLDTESGQVIWIKASHGDWPSRTAVALDYSVWVGNRGFGSEWDANYSNGVHLDADGNLVCSVGAVGICRGVAIDGDGNVWFGTYDGQTLYKVSGTEVNDTDCWRPPCCRLLGTLNVGVSVYGLAIDGNGFLWTASHPNTVKVNTATMQIVDRPSNPSHYGVAIDQNNNVWFGGWSGGGYVHRLLGVSPYTVWNTSVNNVTAVTVDRDGYIWGSSYGTNEVVKIDPATGQRVCASPVSNGNNPHGVAVDAAGKVWVPNRYGGYANRFTSDCVPDGSFPVSPGQELYTYSDMTGMQLRMVTTREGHWIQNFDSGYASPIWHSATWEAVVPASTSVSVSFVSAASEAELVTNHSPVCGPFTASPASMVTACPQLHGRRWLSADVQLNTTQDGVRPTFSNLHVFWTR